MKITSHLTEYHDNIYYALDTTKKFLLPFYYIYFNGVQICEWKSRCNFERIWGVMNLLQCPEKILTFSLLFDIIWHQHWLNFQFASRYFNPSVCSTKKHQNQFHENFYIFVTKFTAQKPKPERKKFVFYIILTFPGHFYLIFHLCCDKVMKAFHFRTKLLLCFFVILFAWKLDNGTLNKQSRTLMFFMIEEECNVEVFLFNMNIFGMEKIISRLWQILMTFSERTYLKLRLNWKSNFLEGYCWCRWD